MNQVVGAYANSVFIIVYTDDLHIDYVYRTFLKLNGVELAPRIIHIIIITIDGRFVIAPRAVDRKKINTVPTNGTYNNNIIIIIAHYGRGAYKTVDYISHMLTFSVIV